MAPSFGESLVHQHTVLTPSLSFAIAHQASKSLPAPILLQSWTQRSVQLITPGNRDNILNNNATLPQHDTFVTIFGDGGIVF